LPYASSLCGACRDACPVKIDLPRLLVDLRADQVEAGDAAWLEKSGMQGFIQTMKSRARYEAAGKLASFGSNLFASLSGGAIKVMPPPFSGWTQSRDFPPFARRSFRELWKERQGRRKAISGDRTGTSQE
jgi:L-lactate dehydrogenase complex protein LldF